MKFLVCQGILLAVTLAIFVLMCIHHAEVYRETKLKYKDEPYVPYDVSYAGMRVIMLVILITELIMWPSYMDISKFNLDKQIRNASDCTRYTSVPRDEAMLLKSMFVLVDEECCNHWHKNIVDPDIMDIRVYDLQNEIKQIKGHNFNITKNDFPTLYQYMK